MLFILLLSAGISKMAALLNHTSKGSTGMTAYEQSQALLVQLFDSRNIDATNRQNTVNALSGLLIQSESDLDENEFNNIVKRLEANLDNASLLAQRDCAYLLGLLYRGNQIMSHGAPLIFPLALEQDTIQQRVDLALHHLQLGMKAGDVRCAIILFSSYLYGEGCFVRQYKFLPGDEVRQCRDHTRLVQFCESTIENDTYPAAVRSRIASIYGASLKGVDLIEMVDLIETNAANSEIRLLDKGLAFPVHTEKGNQYLRKSSILGKENKAIVGNAATFQPRHSAAVQKEDQTTTLGNTTTWQPSRSGIRVH